MSERSGAHDQAQARRAVVRVAAEGTPSHLYRPGGRRRGRCVVHGAAEGTPSHLYRPGGRRRGRCVVHGAAEGTPSHQAVGNQVQTGAESAL